MKKLFLFFATITLAAPSFAGPPAIPPPVQVSSAERTAGTETDLRSFAPADIASMAGTHGGADGKVKVDSAATADYLNGAITAGANVTFTDNGDSIAINASLSGDVDPDLLTGDTDDNNGIDNIPIGTDTASTGAFTALDAAHLTLSAQTSAGTPGTYEFRIADGDNWQIDSDRQGTDDWLAWYTGSKWVAIFNLTDGTRIRGETCYEPVVFSEPDQLQGISDAWPVMHFPAESFPDGFTVTALHIQTSATCTDDLNFEEWSNNGTAWSTDSTVEAITLSGTATEDDGTLSDADIAADAWLYVDLDGSPTDIAYMTVTVCGY